MKKMCKGCYAADTGAHPQQGAARGCVLGYKTDGQGHPAETCPKPRSWREYNKLSKERVEK